MIPGSAKAKRGGRKLANVRRLIRMTSGIRKKEKEDDIHVRPNFMVRFDVHNG